MKKTPVYLWLLTTVLLASCGGGGAELTEPKTIEEKAERIASYQSQIKELELNIEKLEKEILAMGGSLQRPADTIPVTTIGLSKTTYEEFVELTGTVISDKNVAISSEMGGVVTAIYVKEGQAVSAGQLLLSTDDQVLQKSIDELENAYQLAKTVYEKRKSLWDQNIGSEMEYLTAKNNLESLELKLKTTQSQWAKTQIKAPFSGTIDDVITKTGEMAAPGMPLVRLVNLQEVTVQCDVSEVYIGKVKRGDQVTVSFPSINQTLTAKVQNVSQVINPGNRTFKLDVAIANRDGLIKPNLLGYVLIREYVEPNQVVIPTKLIQSGINGDFVYVVANNKVEKRVIQSGRSHNGFTQVVGGLEGNETLIDEGYRMVKEGDYAKVIESVTAQNISHE